MDPESFHRSLVDERPPGNMSSALAGLWWDAKGDWAKAHESAQQDESPEGAWVHAYLHRKEGDLSNASYWYARASKPAAKGSLEREREEIMKALVS